MVLYCYSSRTNFVFIAIAVLRAVNFSQMNKPIFYLKVDVVMLSGEEDSLAIQWMFLHKGEPKRCGCGNWFKLTELDTSKYAH